MKGHLRFTFEGIIFINIFYWGLIKACNGSDLRLRYHKLLTYSHIHISCFPVCWSLLSSQSHKVTHSYSIRVHVHKKNSHVTHSFKRCFVPVHYPSFHPFFLFTLSRRPFVLSHLFCLSLYVHTTISPHPPFSFVLHFSSRSAAVSLSSEEFRFVTQVFYASFACLKQIIQCL